MSDNQDKWAKLAQRELRDTPLSSLDRDYGGIPVKPVYFGEGSEVPGMEPFTRGVRATMYANRPWTIRQYAGFSTARESNAFYRQALDLPALLGLGLIVAGVAIINLFSKSIPH